ncbi:MAG: DUF4974 domain-containing protein [Agriterribacter sp.]
MDFHVLTAEELAMDDSFRNYCLKTNHADIRFWEQWLEQNPGKTSLANQAKEMVLLLSGHHNEQQLLQDKEQFLALMSAHLQKESVHAQYKAPVKKLNSFMFRAAAAVVFIITTALAVMLFNKKEISNNYSSFITSNIGEKKTTTLPDGTRITVNAGSKVDIADDFNKDNREVTLNGEAFFEVKHDSLRPFIIHTRQMDIKVLGTIFNVKAYPEDKEAETSLLQGAVEVIMKKTQKRIILRPNQKIVLSKLADKKIDQEFTVTHLTYDKVDSSFTEVSWIDDRLAFNDQRFDELAKILKRWYNVDFSFKDEEVREFRFTATFENKTINQVLEALQLSRRFKYTINPKEIIISKY